MHGRELWGLNGDYWKIMHFSVLQLRKQKNMGIVSEKPLKKLHQSNQALPEAELLWNSSKKPLFKV